MSTDINEILKERGSRYGSFREGAMLAYQLKDPLHSHPNWKYISADKREAIDTIMSKVSRIVHGDPEYRDSWVDIIGYTQLVLDSIPADPEELANESN